MTMTKSSSPNVTPLIDILLVLLIVFMVIAPSASQGLDAQLPRPAAGVVPPAGDSLVITVDATGALFANHQPVTAGWLRRDLRTREQVLVKGTPDASYGQVAAVVDLARGAGVLRVGLLPR
jgi:biopolymer transport protein ExbD